MPPTGSRDVRESSSDYLKKKTFSAEKKRELPNRQHDSSSCGLAAYSYPLDASFPPSKQNRAVTMRRRCPSRLIKNKKPGDAPSRKTGGDEMPAPCPRRSPELQQNLQHRQSQCRSPITIISNPAGLSEIQYGAPDHQRLRWSAPGTAAARIATRPAQNPIMDVSKP